MVEGREYILERQRKCRRDSAEPWKVGAEAAKTDTGAEEVSASDAEGQETDIEAVAVAQRLAELTLG